MGEEGVRALDEVSACWVPGTRVSGQPVSPAPALCSPWVIPANCHETILNVFFYPESRLRDQQKFADLQYLFLLKFINTRATTSRVFYTGLKLNKGSINFLILLLPVYNT